MGVQQKDVKGEASAETRWKRRRILQTLGGGISLSAIGSTAAGIRVSDRNTSKQEMYRLVMNSPADVRVDYEFAVTGEIVKTIDTGGIFSTNYVTKDSEDEITKHNEYDGTIVRGVTQGGVDAYVYTGQLDTFNATNCNKFNVWVNGTTQPACALNENYNTKVPGTGRGIGDEETIEYLDCTTIRVTGEFEAVILRAWAYAPGIVDFHETESDVSGETVVSVDDSEYPAYIQSAWAFKDSEEAVPGGDADLEAENPRLNECAKRTRPDKPILSVEDITRIGQSAYEITFGYTNPNDFVTYASDSFETGQVDGSPPTRLQPGEHTFTVTWRPKRDDERLTWEFYPSGYGGQETEKVSIATPTHATVREEWTLNIQELREKLDRFAPSNAEVVSPSESSQTIQFYSDSAEATLTVHEDGTVIYTEGSGWWDAAINRDELLQETQSTTVAEAQAQMDPQSAAAENPAVQNVEQTGNTYTVTIAVENPNMGQQGIFIQLILRAVAPQLASYLISHLPNSGSYSDIIISIMRTIATALIRDLFTAEAVTTPSAETGTPTTTERTATGPTTTDTPTTTTEEPTTTTTTTTTDTPTPTTTTETPTTEEKSDSTTSALVDLYARLFKRNT